MPATVAETVFIGCHQGKRIGFPSQFYTRSYQSSRPRKTSHASCRTWDRPPGLSTARSAAIKVYTRCPHPCSLLLSRRPPVVACHQGNGLAFHPSLHAVNQAGFQPGPVTPVTAKGTFRGSYRSRQRPPPPPLLQLLFPHSHIQLPRRRQIRPNQRQISLLHRPIIALRIEKIQQRSAPMLVSV